MGPGTAMFRRATSSTGGSMASCMSTSVPTLEVVSVTLVQYAPLNSAGREEQGGRVGGEIKGAR